MSALILLPFLGKKFHRSFRVQSHLGDSEASPSILFGSHSGSSLSPSDTPIDSIPRHQPKQGDQ